MYVVYSALQFGFLIFIYPLEYMQVIFENTLFKRNSIRKGSRTLPKPNISLRPMSRRPNHNEN